MIIPFRLRARPWALATTHGWLYPLLWSYGGHEVEPDGKTVVIDFPTRTRARHRFRPQILPRHDARRCPSGGPTSATTRLGTPSRSRAPIMAESILWLAKRDFPDIAKVTDQAMNPAGAEGGAFHIMERH